MNTETSTALEVFKIALQSITMIAVAFIAFLATVTKRETAEIKHEVNSERSKMVAQLQAMHREIQGLREVAATDKERAKSHGESEAARV